MSSSSALQQQTVNPSSFAVRIRVEVLLYFMQSTQATFYDRPSRFANGSDQNIHKLQQHQKKKGASRYIGDWVISSAFSFLESNHLVWSDIRKCWTRNMGLDTLEIVQVYIYNFHFIQHNRHINQRIAYIALYVQPKPGIE